MKIEWNRVTPLSKAAAMVLFIAFPLFGFFLGMNYQRLLLDSEYEIPKENINQQVVKIADVNNFNAEDFTYGAGTMTFITADRSLKYFLFYKNKLEEPVVYTILDKNHNTAIPDINVGSNKSVALYDFVNDGFVLINRYFDSAGNTASVSIDFIPINTLIKRNILKTDPIEVLGMGCSSSQILSIPGEVIITQGCLRIDEKYIGSDGNIHMKL